MKALGCLSRIDDFDFKPSGDQQDDSELQYASWTALQIPTKLKTGKVRTSKIIANNSDASLLIACVPRVGEDEFQVSRQSFCQLLECFGMDEQVTHFFQTGPVALYHTASAACPVNYLAVGLFALAWTNDEVRGTTRAIFSPRDSALRSEPKGFLKALELELEQEDRTQPPSPSSPPRLHLHHIVPWAALVRCTETLGRHTRWISGKMWDVEQVTNHTNTYEGPRTSSFLSNPADCDTTIETFSKASRETGYVFNETMELIASHAILQDATEDLVLRLQRGTPSHDDSPNSPCAVISCEGQCHQEIGLLVEGIRSIQRRLGALGLRLQRYQKRAEIQLSVIANLTTHQDASASNALAAASTRLAEESKELANLARKDASSMKTIAVMTMGFLPATYIAALWAVPSLSGDGGGDGGNENDDGNTSRVQTDFGLYWAVTVPVTVIIFLIWFAVNRTREDRETATTLGPWWRRFTIKMTTMMGLFRWDGAGNKGKEKEEEGGEKKKGGGGLNLPR